MTDDSLAIAFRNIFRSYLDLQPSARTLNLWLGVGMLGKSGIVLCVLTCTVLQTGCSVLPDLPRKANFPVEEILLNATCEMQATLRLLDQRRYAKFKPRQWLINITLLPKVDTEVFAGAGYSGKSSSIPVANSSSWVIGSGPGAGVDAKGERNGAVTYNIKSRELIATKALNCEDPRPTFHALSQYLGVADWLVRTATAMDMNPVAEVDKPNFNSQVTVKFAGDGSYSYAFPFGGASASLSGSYTVDEQLQIGLIPLDPPPAHYPVTTLPIGGLPGSVAVNRATVSSVQQARQRSDTIQLENTLRSLRSVQ